MERNKIYTMDCLEGMKNLEDNSIDLVMTSPPYDNLRSYNKGIQDTWNSSVWEPIIKECYRVTANGGVVVWVVNDATIDGSETGTSFKQALHFMSCGFNLHDTMIWRKTNPMPQMRQPRYRQVFEYMFVFSKGTPKKFNPITTECKSAGRKYASTCKNIGGESGRTFKEFLISDEKVLDNIWDIAVAQNDTDHPAVFPAEIAKRHIATWTDINDVVLDPFMGSGTTALECVKMKRKFIGFEINPEYVTIANYRLRRLTGPFHIYGNLGV